jgi:ABC-type dipeptide/oligopeptide/nickel transport system ATPase subunit
MDEGRLKALSDAASRASARRDAAVAALSDARLAARDLQERVDLLDLVANLLRTLIDQEITEGVKAIETLQSEGVQAVFDDQNINVRAEIDVSRGKVNVALVTSQVKEDGTVIEGVSLEGFGGAVSTVQSVLLRLALIVRRGLRPVLFLDESLPAFDERYVLNMAAFLKTLCRKMGVDILLVTHNPALVEAADRAYRIKRDRGYSTFQRLR